MADQNESHGGEGFPSNRGRAAGPTRGAARKREGGDQKLPLCARRGVAWLWLIDPRDQTLDVYQLREGAWSLRRSFGAEATIRAEPFEAVEIPLARIWLP